jgi:hypothetical protein
MRTYRVVPDPKNHADHRATLPGGYPIKNLGLPLGETEGTESRDDNFEDRNRPRLTNDRRVQGFSAPTWGTPQGR